MKEIDIYTINKSHEYANENVHEPLTESDITSAFQAGARAIRVYYDSHTREE